MRVAEVARQLDISVSLVYQLLTTGRLRGTRHGMKRGTWRVSQEQLAQYQRESEATVDRPPEPAPIRQRLKHLHT